MAGPSTRLVAAIPIHRARLTSKDPCDRGAQFTNEELLKAYREKFDADKLEQSLQTALRVRKMGGHPVGPLAALHYIFAQRDPRKADAHLGCVLRAARSGYADTHSRF
jgi:hypothetical protein